jgi:hypothetical protein
MGHMLVLTFRTFFFICERFTQNMLGTHSGVLVQHTMTSGSGGHWHNTHVTLFYEYYTQQSGTTKIS